MSEIAGVLLNSVFLDSLDSDVERLERMNKTLALVPREKLSKSDLDVRPIPTLLLGLRRTSASSPRTSTSGSRRCSATSCEASARRARPERTS